MCNTPPPPRPDCGGAFRGEFAALGGAHHAQVYATGDPNCARQILLFHEWWGINDDMKEKADELAARGWRALAVDFYDRKVAKDAAKPAP